MNTITNDPKEVVDSAMCLEMEGHQILLDACENAKDPLSKATFQFLADQELKHIEAIKAYATALADAGDFDPSALAKPLDKVEACRLIQGIFSKIKTEFEETQGKDEERQAVYSVALDMETRGHDFYKKAAEQSTNETAKKLFEFLTNEESNHFEIIQETADFLKQPDAFMAVEERWMQI